MKRPSIPISSSKLPMRHWHQASSRMHASCSVEVVDWKAPFGVARDTFSNFVQLAKKIESSTSDVVGYGLASKPVTDSTQDALWRGMLT